MPFIGSVRGNLGAQGRFGRLAARGSSAGNPATPAQLVSDGQPNGVYWINTDIGAQQSYVLTSGADSGGWAMAYNILFDEAWMQTQRGPDGGTVGSNLSSYNANGFWTDATPGGSTSEIFDQTKSNRGGGAYLSSINKIMIMYHAGANTTNGLAYGWYTRNASVSSKSLRSWFNDNNRNTVWSTGNRTATLRSSWSTPWGNNARPYPGGGDLFVDNTDNPGSITDVTNMAGYNLVLNAQTTANGYGYGASVRNDIRFTTTIAGPYNGGVGQTSNSPYGHTTGGIGIDHEHSGHGGSVLAIALYDYCDGRRNAIYGNGTQITQGAGLNILGPGCYNSEPANFNTSVLGVSIFVKQ